MKAKLCAFPGCFDIATIGKYCKQHQKSVKQETSRREILIPRDRWGESLNDKFYHTQRWRNLIKDMPRVCAICGAEEDIEFHHVIPPRGDEQLFFDATNIVPLCHQCHTRITLCDNRNTRRKKNG